MKNAIALLKRPVLSEEEAQAPAEPGYSLNIAGVYQDSVTREWALQTCHRATRLAGEESIQSKWYHANALSHPALLVHAVRAALAADVIVVSVYAAHELPLDLYVWIDAWLPRRPARVGALRALVGVAQPLESHSVRTMDYLQAVARKAQLDFIPQECQRPAATPASSSQGIAERDGAAGSADPDLYRRSYDAYRH